MKTIKRRRKEGKTDYLNRLKLLKSGKPRVVFRKTNKYIISQYVLSDESKDIVKISLTSKILLKYGWPKELSGSLKSIPASYLIGYLMGKKIIKGKLGEPIIDFGMIRTIHKTKVFAFIKGIIDSGINIKSKKETFPEESRIIGSHLKNKINFEEIKSKLDTV